MCEDCIDGEREYCYCGCGADLDYEGCFNEEDSHDYEGDLVRALSRATVAERNAIATVIKNRMPICVGTWAASGEKQSYTCLMGTAAAVMTDNSITAWVADYLETANARPGGSNDFLRTCGVSDGGFEVPGAFDNLFEARADLTVPAVGNAAMLLNARGRDLLSELLTQANLDAAAFSA